MARKKNSFTKEHTNNGATLGFENQLWKAADKLRNNLDAAEYKHVVLGLIFLRYISDAFEEHRRRIVFDERSGQAPGNRRESRSFTIHFAQSESCRENLCARDKHPTIIELIINAVVSGEFQVGDVQ